MTGAVPEAGLGRLLLALQFTDSSFPSGMYTLSHGLEGLAQEGRVDADSLADMVHGILRHSTGPADATALALAWSAVAEHGGGAAPGKHGDMAVPGGAVPGEAGPDASGCGATELLAALTRIDRRLHATRLTREFRDGATRTGRQVLDLAAEILDDPVVDAWNAHVRAKRAPGSQSVVMGVVYARGGLTRREAVAADLTAVVISMAGAALRLRLADHRSAQALVRGAAPVIEEVTDAALRRPLEWIGGSAPGLDLASCRHEHAEARLFAS
ncbi:urease accessory protein UreF [Dietzia sp. NCCP-2495]|uniref:urease accessory protein UreF n=1 Tax=Dietzia sp. NCCP-2495 TaxID=2934675 RepID=UPI002231FFCA|nr:urease accessory UreF family protein [Dietzia sp. NCCP-2495]GLB63374.1 urease accessory protein UreF [Dietzia sp. NCCP-2495]